MGWRGLVAKLTLPRLLALALVLRVGWVIFCHNEPVSDQSHYHFSAIVIAQGKGYINSSGIHTNFYPVGYPGLLAPFYALIGPYLVVAFAVNVILGCIAVAGAYHLGKLLFGENAGRLSGLLVAVHPTFVLMSTVLASENAYCAALPWAFWLMVRDARERGSAPWLAPAAGVVIGLLAYVRSPALMLLAGPLVFGWVEKAALRRTLVHAGVVALAAFITLAPWGLRNQRYFGKFSVTSYNGGCNLYLGNNAHSDGAWSDPPEFDEVRTIGLDETDHMLRERALDFIKEHPSRFLSLTLNRVQMTLRSDTIAPEWNRIGIVKAVGGWAVLALKSACSLAHWGLILALLFSLVRRRRKLERADAELAFGALVLAAPFVLILGGNRFALPLMALVCVWVSSLLRGPAADSSAGSAPPPAPAPT
jgi:4-amino-4-deoxy-L-arabinose transferase-like glycosyltransferase